MALEKSDIKSTYPLPSYNYRVTILHGPEAAVISFAEVSGLSLDYEPITYKHGLSFLKGVHIIPGMPQPIRLTMRKGLVQGQDFLHRWFASAYTVPVFPSMPCDILIDLCDEAGQAVVRWTVQGALPIKLTAPTFDANSNDVAIETLELVAHGLQIDYHL
jgi:phage tail-like protein